MIKIKRIYDEPSRFDGTRILVDRLWPRGMKKDNADIDVWMKDIAPSSELREWFAHDPSKWNDFEERYWGELTRNHEAFETIVEYVNEGPVTFLFAAHDPSHNNAVALKEFIENASSRRRGYGIRGKSFKK